MAILRFRSHRAVPRARSAVHSRKYRAPGPRASNFRARKARRAPRVAGHKFHYTGAPKKVRVKNVRRLSHKSHHAVVAHHRHAAHHKKAVHHGHHKGYHLSKAALARRKGHKHPHRGSHVHHRHHHISAAARARRIGKHHHHRGAHVHHRHHHISAAARARRVGKRHPHRGSHAHHHYHRRR